MIDNIPANHFKYFFMHPVHGGAAILFKIEFKKSGKTFNGDESFGNLLEFAEAKGVQLESNYRIGVCGSCKIKLISGKVVMDPEEALEEGDREQNMILPCVATPQTDLAIEA